MSGRRAQRLRSGVLPLLAAVLLQLLSGCGGDRAGDLPFGTDDTIDGPDVVVILIDTLRADHLGVYGSQRGLTPNLDAFAAEAHVFDKAVVTSSWTRPSIASMLTSRYPTALGLLGRDDTLHPAVATFPEVLRHFGGYRTLGLIGNGNVGAGFGFGNGFDVYRMPRLRRSYPGGFAIPVAEGITQEALEMVDAEATDRPLLLMTLYVDPHDPYLPHPGLTGPEPPGRFSGARRELLTLDRPGTETGPDDHRRIRFLYAGEVRYVDLWVGELLRGLRQRGRYDESLIVITADHGEGLWDHGMRAHGTDLYEEQIHVPLLVKYPGMTPADARRIDTPVSLVDLAPTILETVGLPLPPSFQGADLTPLARGEDRDPALEQVYSELDLDGRDFESIRQGPLKLIAPRRRGGGKEDRLAARELYDLSRDPAERHDLLADGASPTAVDGTSPTPLDSALERWRLALLAAAVEREEVQVELDAETRRSLRALGYLRDDGADDDSRAAGPQRPDLPSPPPTRSTIRLGEVVEGADQILSGLDPMSHAAPGTPLVEEATVYLLRRGKHERWRVSLTVPASGDDRLPRVVDVGIDLEAPVRTTLTEGGAYQIDGRLREGGTGDAVRLDLRCFLQADGAGLPATATEPCASVREISLW